MELDRSLVSRWVLMLCALFACGASAQIYDDDLGNGGIGGDNGFGDDLDDDDDDDDDVLAVTVGARLRGLSEVPSISTAAVGFFRADIDDASSMITYQLMYQDLQAVEQAHIHVGQVHTNGGVSAFLCTNLDNGPPDVQPCPEGAAEISGTIMAAQVVGPAEQGVEEGEFEELLAAIRAGAAYVNVHTTTFPTGEVRGQIVPADR